MVYPDGQISSIVVPAELRVRHLPLLEGSRFGDWLVEDWLFFESAGGPAADALGFGMLGERSGEGELVNRFVGGIFESLLGHVLLGEVAEGTVGVLRRVLVLPRFVGLVVLLAKDALELVLTCVSQ